MGPSIGSPDIQLDSLTQQCVSFFASGDDEGNEMQKKRFFCKWCGKTFWNKTACLGHVNSQHLFVKPFTCRNCNTSFSYKQSLKRHQRDCPVKQM